MSKTVNTVLGPVSSDNLGTTLMHEHLIFGYPGWQYDSAAPAYNREEAAQVCIEMISQAQQYGLKTIVDATPNDGTRDPELYKIVSDKTGVNIICATGLYTEAEGAAAYFKTRALFSGNPQSVVKEIFETMMKDLTQGIGDTGVKAGVIKVGTGHNAIAPYEQMIMEAAVLAQKETGVPIITHTEAGTMAPQQADFLINKGADVKRLMIGHMCGNSNLQYHLEVLKKGPFLGFDRFGLDVLYPDVLRTGTVIGLVGLGFEKQIMLSHDSIINWLGRQFPVTEPMMPLVANWNLLHIFKNIIPALKKANITDEQIHTIMTDNPRRLFEGE
ncbi:phosphotriesterase family protein [Desulfotruncus alcoholivorax]|uniref:phosphotriesterase family protein n=1 Tax=Desulfotruncus alcoholivorax TaxID=265477 RepID=UPI000408DEEE|nr:phosphotriesterase [Desulfotruncus alcoholivorax]